MKNFATMLKPFAMSIALLALIGIGQSVANADPVTYSTTGAFSGTGAAGTVLTLGGITITFTGVTSTANPTFGGGTFTFDAFGSFGTFGSGSGSATNQTFTLTINQTIPSVGGGLIMSQTLTGTIATEGSTLLLSFNNPSPGTGLPTGPGRVVIGNHIYEAFNTVIAEPGDPTSLNGRISETPIPEPATMLLLGTGLAGVAARFRKRRKSA